MKQDGSIYVLIYFFGLLYLMLYYLFSSDVLRVLSGIPGFCAHVSRLCWPDSLHPPVQTRLQQARSWVVLSLRLAFVSLCITHMFMLISEHAVLFTRLFAGLWILIIAGFMRVSRTVVLDISTCSPDPAPFSPLAFCLTAFTWSLLDFLPK